jgi:hypothetical protein
MRATSTTSTTAIYIIRTATMSTSTQLRSTTPTRPDARPITIVAGTHGPGCGHEAVPHGDHVDYLVSGHLHHPHDGHCDDHGALELA